MNLDSSNRVPVLRFKDDEGEAYPKWKFTRLGDVCQVNTGPFGTQLHESDYVSVGTPIVTVEHLGELGIRHTNLPLVSNFHKNKLHRYTLHSGDIVFSRVGSVDRNSIVSEEEEGWLFSGRLLRIRANDLNVFPKFLSFSLQRETTKYRIRSIAVGQTMPSLNTALLSSLHIEFPTIQEQQKIANFLSSVDTRIEQLEKKKSLLEQYKKGLMQKLFSQEIRFKDDEGEGYPEWEEIPLKELGQTFGGLSGKSKDEFGFGKRYVQYMQVYNDSKINLSNCGLVKIQDREKQNRVILGDILFTISSETRDEVGISSVVLEEPGELYLNSFCFGMRLKTRDLLPSFARYLFRNVAFRKQMYRLSQGSTRYNLSKSAMIKTSAFLPRQTEQQKIANFLSSVDRKIELIDEQIIKTRAFKKGLLQQMFV